MAIYQGKVIMGRAGFIYQLYRGTGQEWIRTTEGVSQRIYSLTFYSVVDAGGQLADKLIPLRARIKDLPSGVGVTKTASGRGREFWRVRLGKRFTGGPVVKKDFSNLADARAWIFGEGQSERAKPGHVLELKSKAGLSAFELSPAEIAEAAAAMKSCKEAGISLSEAVRFAIKHSRPPGGSKSLKEAIDALIRSKTEAGRSARHLRGLRWNLEKFAETQGKEKSVHEVQRHRFGILVKRAVLQPQDSRKLPPRSWNLVQFRGRPPLDGRESLRLYREAVGVGPRGVRLKPEEASKLLAACPDAFLPGVCLKLFAGLRTSELLSLDWSEVSASEVVVRGAKAKTRQRRIVAHFRESGSLVATSSQALRARRPIFAKCVASLAGSYRGICRFDASAQRPSAQLRQLSLRAAPKRKPHRRRDGKFSCDDLPALSGGRYTGGRGEILVSCPLAQIQRDRLRCLK